jgi:hypothetical protein
MVNLAKFYEPHGKKKNYRLWNCKISLEEKYFCRALGIQERKKHSDYPATKPDLFY